MSRRWLEFDEIWYVTQYSTTNSAFVMSADKNERNEMKTTLLSQML